MSPELSFKLERPALTKSSADAKYTQSGPGRDFFFLTLKA